MTDDIQGIVKKFLRERERAGYKHSHCLTYNGLYVAGLKRRMLPNEKQIVYSGRVLLSDDDRGHADYAMWTMNGTAINHNYGNLIQKLIGA